MNVQAPANLEEAIRESGEGWLIDSFAPPSQAIAYFRLKLETIQSRATELLRTGAPELTESSLVREYARNPYRVKGFFQALGGERSPDMLLMAWRIIQGMEIKEFHIDHRRQESFEMTVVLVSPNGDQDPPYRSTNARDLALFRHIISLEVSGRPVFDGFYALRLKDSKGRTP